MRTYVTILAGRTAAEVRPVVSSGDPTVVEAALRAIREQAARETGADTTRARAERSLRAAVPSLERLHEMATEGPNEGGVGRIELDTNEEGQRTWTAR